MTDSVFLQLEGDVRKFELFLSSHMFVLANSPKKDDILQFALIQPDDSELYTQASYIIKGQKKKSWFKWKYVCLELENLTIHSCHWPYPYSNKESDPEKYVLKLRVHEEGISSCQFSKNGDKVLSCAGTEVKVRA